MARWKAVHEEHLGRPDRTLTIFAGGEDDEAIFEVNDHGVEFWYFDTAKEAVEFDTQVAIATACYGYVMLMWEEKEVDEWLNRIQEERTSEEITTCKHDGSCDDEFQLAQIALGNVEER